MDVASDGFIAEFSLKKVPDSLKGAKFSMNQEEIDSKKFIQGAKDAFDVSKDVKEVIKFQKPKQSNIF